MGTTSPTDKFCVGTLGSGGSTVITIGASTTGVSSLYFGDGTGAARFRGYFDYYHSSDSLAIGTAGSEKARIDSSGRLLLGTTSAPSASNKGLAIQDNGSFGKYIASATNITTVYSHFEVINPNGTVGSIQTNGSSTSYNTSSDYRLKDVDGPITNSGAYIDALKPVQGSWKVDGSRFIGLIAHEVQEVSETPIATGEKDGEEMQGMDYSAPELIANLIAEIQSLRARMAQLEGA